MLYTAQIKDQCRIEGGRLIWRRKSETIILEPHGTDSVRVRIAYKAQIADDLPQALLPADKEPTPEVSFRHNAVRLKNGAITAELTADGVLRFLETSSGKELLAQPDRRRPYNPSRRYKPLGGDDQRCSIEFKAYDDEHLYGLGQHVNGTLDQKGCSVELIHHNTEFTIPVIVSSRGYGFLWNHPGTGRVDFARNVTRWSADRARQMDFWITAGPTPASIIEHYSAATGRPPQMPEHVFGFWQSKLRYRNRDELMEIARGYKDRALPLDVVVIDYFHWTAMGEWQFDETDWPDAQAMISELEAMGVKVMVSVWPTVGRWADTFNEMDHKNYLLRNERGEPVQRYHPDRKPKWENEIKLPRGLPGNFPPIYFYDPTNPEARAYIWDKIKSGYLSKGVKIFWLDCSEPEFKHFEFDNLRYHAGNGEAVTLLYPNAHAQAFYEGMTEQGEQDVVLLSRAGWAGIQRYGAILWSGDIDGTFDVLRDQITAGLNVAMSGVPYWNTDIGGFLNPAGNEDAGFRELLIRWFQFGAFCPVMRLHSARETNEAWSFGTEAGEILEAYLTLREGMKPYLMEQMHMASKTGAPIMRPMIYDFPEDDSLANLSDQYMLGPDLLVAPVLQEGATSRSVYLPEGSWTNSWTGEVLDGGQFVTVNAPLDIIPVFSKSGTLIEEFQQIARQRKEHV